MKNKFVSLWVIASLAIAMSSFSLASKAEVTKEKEVADRIHQANQAFRADIQRIREERIRLKEEQKRIQVQEAIDRKREAVAREEQRKQNAAALVEAKRESEQKASALLAQQEKEKLEAQVKALKAERERQVALLAERERQVALAARLAKLEKEEKLVQERAAKFEVDSACMDDPDPNCSAKNKALRAQRALKTR